MKLLTKSTFILSVFILLIPQLARALPLVGDVKENVPTTDDGNIDVLPDASDDWQWYHLPGKAKLATEEVGGKSIPMFQFLKFNFDDTSTAPNGEKRGAIVNFGVTNSLTKRSLDEICKYIGNKYGKDPIKIRLGMIPIDHATVTLLVTSGDGKFATSVLGSSEGARHPGVVMPFSIEMSQNGSAVYEKLLNGSAGIGINMLYDYTGVTPVVDCEILGDWQKTYTHFSKMTDLSVKVSCFYFGASVQSTTTQIRDELRDDSSVVIKWNPLPDPVKFPDLQKRIEDSILLRILNAVLDVKPPTPESPATAVAGNTGGFFGGANYAVTTKDVTKITQGAIHFSYIGRATIQVNQDPVGGFISLASYPKEIKDELFVEVEHDPFFNNITITPHASIDPTSYAIRSIKYSFTVKDNASSTIDRSFTAKGGQMVPDFPTPQVNFATSTPPKPVLAATTVRYQPPTGPILSRAGNDVALPSNGSVEMDFVPDEVGLEAVTIDISNMLFSDEVKVLEVEYPERFNSNLVNRVVENRRSEPNSKLEPTARSLDDAPSHIKVVLKHGTDTPFNVTLLSKYKNQPVYWFVKKDDQPITCSISAQDYSNSGISKEYSRNAEKDLRDGGLNLYIGTYDFK